MARTLLAVIRTPVSVTRTRAPVAQINAGGNGLSVAIRVLLSFKFGKTTVETIDLMVAILAWSRADLCLTVCLLFWPVIPSRVFGN